ncbi:MAG TPA: phage holin family protein [Xanthomonadaceae bacterium]|nr:phage holin family protein [Xanthomonadaceae bacterium]
MLLLGRDLHSVAHAQLRLAALETRHAGESLVGIVVLGLVAAVLYFSAWLALIAAGLMTLVELGVLTASVALLLGAVINVVLALLLMVLVRQRSRAFLFSATVDSLRPTPSVALTQGMPE